MPGCVRPSNLTKMFAAAAALGIAKTLFIINDLRRCRIYVASPGGVADWNLEAEVNRTLSH